MWQPSTFYPDPAVHILHSSFAKYRLPLAAVERLGTGLRWAEGPVCSATPGIFWSATSRNNRILKWEEETGVVSVFRRPSEFANGNTRDHQGRLITCEHGGRRVTRTEHSGAITVLMDRFEGKRLNSPNDVVVKSDGSICSPIRHSACSATTRARERSRSCPAASIASIPRRGRRTCWRTASPAPTASPSRPTSVPSMWSRAGPARAISWPMTYPPMEPGSAAGRVLIDAGPGTPDGFRLDEDGNLWCGWGMGAPELDGVMVFSPHGEPIGRIQLPERCANLCFGGVKRNRLFMAASQSILCPVCQHAGSAVNRNTVFDENSSPGRRVVLGKVDWFGLSG